MAVAIWSSGIVIMFCFFFFLWYVMFCLSSFILHRVAAYTRGPYLFYGVRTPFPSICSISAPYAHVELVPWLILSLVLARTPRYGRFYRYTGYGCKLIQHRRLGEEYLPV
jgi:hypothetical protein